MWRRTSFPRAHARRSIQTHPYPCACARAEKEHIPTKRTPSRVPYRVSRRRHSATVARSATPRDRWRTTTYNHLNPRRSTATRASGHMSAPRVGSCSPIATPRCACHRVDRLPHARVAAPGRRRVLRTPRPKRVALRGCVRGRRISLAGGSTRATRRQGKTEARGSTPRDHMTAGARHHSVVCAHVRTTRAQSFSLSR